MLRKKRLAIRQKLARTVNLLKELLKVVMRGFECQQTTSKRNRFIMFGSSNDYELRNSTGRGSYLGEVAVRFKKFVFLK